MVGPSPTAAPVRRSLLLFAVSLLALTAFPSVAAADYESCAEVWSIESDWAEHEDRFGLSVERLDDLEPVIPLLEECHDLTVGRLGKGVGQWASLVVEHFPPHEVDRVLCLMAKESGGNPWARNPSSGASGLMQVMPFWAGAFGYSRNALFDPEINLWIARRIRDQQGWWAWSPYQRGACR